MLQSFSLSGADSHLSKVPASSDTPSIKNVTFSVEKGFIAVGRHTGERSTITQLIWNFMHAAISGVLSVGLSVVSVKFLSANPSPNSAIF